MEEIEIYKHTYASVMNGPVDGSVVDEILSNNSITNEVYRLWLIETGGGPIGPEWFDGPHELKESQKKYAEEEWEVPGFVVGWDGAGNPMVMKEDGSIVCPDNNFGGVHEFASSFHAYLKEHTLTSR